MIKVKIKSKGYESGSDKLEIRFAVVECSACACAIKGGEYIDIVVDGTSNTRYDYKSICYLSIDDYILINNVENDT